MNLTIQHKSLRTNRMGEKSFDEFFNEIVRNCTKRNRNQGYLIDTTDVAANVNYPSNRLICDAFRKVIRETRVHILCRTAAGTI